ncbi:hypothetical protein J1614_003831 [Plenodomus biglobosus]|nr:hypothetical protein J1614_003831 [Plenodomus biglobosus]
MSTPQPRPQPTAPLLPTPLILHPPTLTSHTPLLPFTPFTPCTPLLQLLKTPTTPSPLPVDFLEILENWRIPNFDTWAVLPEDLVKAWEIVTQSEGTATSQGKKRTEDTKDGDEGRGGEDEKKATNKNKGKIQIYPWTSALLSSLLILSKLTVGNRTRAHNLMMTYYAARVRENTGRNNITPGTAGEIAQLADEPGPRDGGVQCAGEEKVFY